MKNFISGEKELTLKLKDGKVVEVIRASDKKSIAINDDIDLDSDEIPDGRIIEFHLTVGVEKFSKHYDKENKKLVKSLSGVTAGFVLTKIKE